MPYIKTEEVQKVRKAIKEAFPKFKFSIRQRDHSVLYVTVLKADFAIDSDRYIQVNHFRPEHVEGKAGVFVQKLLKVIDKAHPNYTESTDGDYGNIPHYYLRVSFGDYETPYQQIAA